MKVRGRDCGTSSNDWLPSLAPESSSSKTLPAEPSVGCPRCGKDCASSATIRPLWLFPPKTLAPLIDGRASSSSAWPTPTVKGNDNRAGLSPTSGDGLATAVRLWPTACATDCKGSSVPGQHRGQLSEAVAWPMPTATSYGSNQGGSAGRTGPIRLSLNGEVQKWSTPLASDGPNGGPNLQRKGGSLPAEVAGTLNPEWVEMLMGFPPGWTSIDGPPDEAKPSTPKSRPARSRHARSPTEPHE